MIRRFAALAIGLAVCTGPAVASPAQEAACAAAASYSEARRGLAVFVLKDGRPLCFALAPGVSASDAHPLHSGTKSFAGAMAVLAADDGLLDLDEPVAATITEWRDDPVRSRITIRQLLSLVSGIESTIGRPPGYAAAIASVPTAEPGARFSYGPAPFQIFGEVMRRKLAAKGLDPDPSVWLTQRLFKPLELRVGEWRRTPEGDPLLPQGMLLTPTDWAKFGEWVRLAGREETAVPLRRPELLKAFATGTTALPGYGLTWWLPPKLAAGAREGRVPRAAMRLDFASATDLPADLMMAAGAGDQRLYVSASKGLTVVRFARLTLADLTARPAGPDEWSDVAFLRLVDAIVASEGK
ncbi:MAG: beta-lactamase family protein [Alphaproteobacteria bacterium]|nr:beta-lactamase family protein [Alphaproteobacteria bacterium]